ncbi:MAG: cytidine deaminase [Candidatus Infernicultor aquiphilus]|uniref:Cytidine deaminase n=1 Tax=Candidatus Infernicultor aquiphilus TaxID=1805029 RepID=A0A1J5GAM8_9BACT|nr:cytidine deaminase [bacterium]OIP69749.1 MAG: cytidine deaminase [Candidatus Atribacteria bacterium CG2_30_33_13]PIU25384.1 MAG: cytidine deaminase [Candidatus Atribacteria bacterium CG08_land_8_20_14_0_20_33_29]PIW12043.1 MAG: cytidine deaminase [Candidatus Atribacteria bacterium CG17_big_fil_post_rev_8_21_14_2_50_34_11]PIX34728.1 MAG: cytidine deaminase [Candidatus Atribacteria bacterium CG_4_8_14_3_um_filter_34_18]PIY33166.1 MAG: cytidine deaminase [Candidatus Atribacteria bacterium CG_4
MNEKYKKLIGEAEQARKKAYTPYSKFKVGAAILTSEGRIFSGCNIENASFGLTICAERVAVFKAISEGFKKFEAIAIIADTIRPCYPCGACRQVILEFGEDITLIMANLKGDIKINKIKELLPEAFNKNDLL